MRLILHIGTEKTGSTAIQAQLLADRGALAGRGIQLCSTAGEGNHRALVAAFMPEDCQDDFLRNHNLVDTAARDAWRADFLQAFSAEVQAAKAVADVFVVSSEHFHSRLLQPDSVARLADFLHPLFSEVSVVCYLRRQDEMALSFYSEKLRAGFIPPEILPLRNVRRRAGSLPPFFDFESLLQRWERAFGARCISPRLYPSGSLAGDDVVQDFFQTVGLGTLACRPPEIVNPALSQAAQAALKLYNEGCGGQEEAARDRHRHYRQRLVDYLHSLPAKDRGQLPARDDARTFYQAFSASNARVATHWFGRTALFNEDFSVYPQEPQAVDWVSAARLLADFVAWQGEVEAPPAC